MQSTNPKGCPLGLAAALFLVLAVGGRAAGETPTSSPLMLEIWVNGQTRHELVRTIVRTAGAIFADCADLRAAGLRAADMEECPLSGEQGLEATVDESDQRLMVTATHARLLSQIVSARPTPVEETLGRKATSPTSGAVLNYDFSAQSANFSRPTQSLTAGAALDLAAFAPWGAFRADGFADTSGGRNRFVRLNSTFSFDDPSSLRRITVGDAITGDLQWSRSVRIAGVQIERDFLLEPNLVTQPMPQFFGESAVPSTLDVFVNNMRVFEGKVEQGPFEIRDLPVITGRSQVTVVTRDVLGRELTQSMPLYTTDQFLAKGLTEYAFDAGLLRRAYGLNSFSYSGLAATATGRYGLTNALTLEGHSEVGPGIGEGGVGAAVALAPYGAASFGLAASHSSSGEGLLASARMETRQEPISLFGELTATTGHYRDIASSDGAAPPNFRAQLGGNIALRRFGSLSLSWVAIKSEDQRTQFATANYAVSFAGGYNFSVVGFHDLDAHMTGVEIFLTIPLGKRTNGEISTRLGADRPQYEATASRTADPYGGVGYRLTTDSGPSGGVEAVGIWTGQNISANGGVSSLNGVTAGRVGASGSLIAMGGDVYASRRVDGALALVDAGQSGVRVYQENREVGTTGANGKMLITGLVPYGRNTIGVSADDYPMDVLVSSPERVVTPNRFGVMVDLAPPRGSPVLVALLLPDGGPPPLGGRVMLDDQTAPLVVGAHGRIFIAHLPAPIRGHLVLGEHRCSFLLTPPPPSGADSIPEIGPITCSLEKTP